MIRNNQKAALKMRDGASNDRWIKGGIEEGKKERNL